MKSLNTCIMVMRQIGSTPQDDIEQDSFEIIFEDESGREGFSEISIVDYADIAASHLENQQWREIESAPKDKLLIGLITKKNIVGHKIRAVAEIAYCPVSERWYSPVTDYEIKATHWMPLPTAPES